MVASDSSGEYAMDEQIRAPLVLAFLGSGTLVLFAQSNYEPKGALIAFAGLSLLFIGVAWAMAFLGFAAAYSAAFWSMRRS